MRLFLRRLAIDINNFYKLRLCAMKRSFYRFISKLFCFNEVFFLDSIFVLFNNYMSLLTERILAWIPEEIILMVTSIFSYLTFLGLLCPELLLGSLRGKVTRTTSIVSARIITTVILMFFIEYI